MKIKYKGKVISNVDLRFNEKKVTVGKDSRVSRKRKPAKKANFLKIIFNLFGVLLVVVFLSHEICAYLDTKNVSKAIVEPAKAQETPVAEPVRDTVAREARPEKVETIEEMITRYFPENPKKALAIAQCESHTDPNKMNTKKPDYSIGLFQINILGNLAKNRPTESELKDPETNIKFARMLYESAGRSFSRDWVVCDKLTKGVK
jgi:soluble lytic murein transglycosylase-like protein